jgi:CheY-specific phosphatase CheX
MMTGRAVTVLNDRRHHLRVSPPTLIAGDNVTISNSGSRPWWFRFRPPAVVIVNVAMETL